MSVMWIQEMEYREQVSLGLSVWLSVWRSVWLSLYKSVPCPRLNAINLFNASNTSSTCNNDTSWRI